MGLAGGSAQEPADLRGLPAPTRGPLAREGRPEWQVRCQGHPLRPRHHDRQLRARLAPDAARPLQRREGRPQHDRRARRNGRPQARAQGCSSQGPGLDQHGAEEGQGGQARGRRPHRRAAAPSLRDDQAEGRRLRLRSRRTHPPASPVAIQRAGHHLDRSRHPQVSAGGRGRRAPGPQDARPRRALRATHHASHSDHRADRALGHAGRSGEGDGRRRVRR